jgi:hypothetical protein
VRLDDRRHDGQTETGATAAARPGRITAGEPFEHLRNQVGRDAWAVVGHRQHCRSQIFDQ